MYTHFTVSLGRSSKLPQNMQHFEDNLGGQVTQKCCGQAIKICFYFLTFSATHTDAYSRVRGYIYILQGRLEKFFLPILCFMKPIRHGRNIVVQKGGFYCLEVSLVKFILLEVVQ